MANEDKIIYVYDGFSHEDPVLLGTLYIGFAKGSEVFSFEYDKEWLRDNGSGINIDPELQAFTGRQFPQGNGFGVFQDSAPDRWGRVLMNKRERIRAAADGRKARKLYESDYLLGVYDETRMGGLRFKTNRDEAFVSYDKEAAAPPWTSLRTLEEATRNYEKDENSLASKWINQLIKPGSSLGGARPKATVVDAQGQLWIAKFPSKHDESDSGAWEKVVHDLARMCGLNVPESKLEKFSDLGSTFLVKRFDRDSGRRIHFSSAMTLLGKKDGASAADGASYLEIAGFIKAYGSNPKADLLELWKRIVFNMAVTNTDDHLRNHAFILSTNGWTLSPLYDVNPVPYGDELSLLVDDADNRISLDLAIRTAPRYGITETRAKEIANEMITVIMDNWERLAKKYGISQSQIEYMKPAFGVI